MNTNGIESQEKTGKKKDTTNTKRNKPIHTATLYMKYPTKIIWYSWFMFLINKKKYRYSKLH